jgi:hypothetical protein
MTVIVLILFRFMEICVTGLSLQSQPLEFRLFTSSFATYVVLYACREAHEIFVQVT